MNSKRDWTIYEALDTNDLNNESYQIKYQEQLQLGRRQWMDEYQKSRNRNVADQKQAIQAILQQKEKEVYFFRQQVEQKDKEGTTKEQEIHRLRQQLQVNDKESHQYEEKSKTYERLCFRPIYISSQA